MQAIFRGFDAAASLKLQNYLDQLPISNGSSAAFDAAASLKLGLPCSNHHVGRIFRGFDAAASLKYR